jgi:iron complex transport system substrate-binding protein
MRAAIDDLVARVPERAEPLTYYHELDDTLYTATRNSFVGELYALAGLESIADDLDDGTGYPQLSNEFVISADPDFIFLADAECCGQSIETLAARPGWAGMSAVTAGRVVLLDDDISSRWGPRAVDLLERIVEAVADAS